MLVKILLIVVVAILVRGTLPRYRVDQLVAQH
ncbi:MAG: NADH-quinone oxidoreductase subunit H [Chitinophagaceae bacterium]|nr:NADH-quinone oxidoreductase subunit H [Chitinophagaceae bacterium]